MPQKPYTVAKGNPEESPFDTTLQYRLAVDLPLNDGTEEIVFADLVVPEDDARKLQQSFWLFNNNHKELEWKYATRLFKSPLGKYDVVRVWKVARPLAERDT